MEGLIRVSSRWTQTSVSPEGSMTPPHTARRLSAILVADAVGYSRLVEIDEQGTLTALRNLRQEVLDPLLADHGGRIVKLLGDGLIAEFGSVVEAVTCAAAWQVKLAEVQEAVPADRRILFRIGINLGDDCGRRRRSSG